jgi:hypothetical protein
MRSTLISIYTAILLSRSRIVPNQCCDLQNQEEPWNEKE